jgi:hypothetical protein
MIRKTHCQFSLTDLHVVKSDSGATVLEAAISDDQPDRFQERVSDKALESMARQLKENKIPLLPTHRDTFDIGFSIDARIENTASAKRLIASFQLDMRFPEAQVLAGDTENGVNSKQLSIGGNLNGHNPQAVLWETHPQHGAIRILNDILLDHVAVTRADHAVNPRTEFLSLTSQIFRSMEESGAWDEIEKAHMAASASLPWSFSTKDGDALIKRGGFALYSASNTFRDVAKSAVEKGAYKLPHHKLRDGQWELFPRGVVAATVVFAGGRGGVKLEPTGQPKKLTDEERIAAAGVNGHKSATDRNGVRDHLLAHYRELGLTPPSALAKSEDYDEDTLIKQLADQGVDLSWLPHVDWQALFEADSDESAIEVLERADHNDSKDVTVEKPIENEQTVGKGVNLSSIILGLGADDKQGGLLAKSLEAGRETISKAGAKMSSATRKKIAAAYKDLNSALIDAGFEIEEEEEVPAEETTKSVESFKPASETTVNAPAETPADAPAETPAETEAPAETKTEESAPAEEPAKTDEAPAETEAPAEDEAKDEAAADETKSDEDKGEETEKAADAPSDPAGASEKFDLNAIAALFDSKLGTLKSELKSELTAEMTKRTEATEKAMISALDAMDKKVEPVAEQVKRIARRTGGSGDIGDTASADPSTSKKSVFASIFSGAKDHAGL